MSVSFPFGLKKIASVRWGMEEEKIYFKKCALCEKSFLVVLNFLLHNNFPERFSVSLWLI